MGAPPHHLRMLAPRVEGGEWGGMGIRSSGRSLEKYRGFFHIQGMVLYAGIIEGLL